MADNSSNINDNAQSPKRASGDQGSAEQHSIPDQIEADRYEKANQAAKKGPGIKYRRFRHGGTTF